MFQKKKKYILLLKMTEQLSEEQIAEYKESFSLFDKDNDGIIKVEFLGLLVQSLNQYPTKSEINDMINEVDPENTGVLDFPEFISLMARRNKNIDPYEELMEAFKILTKAENNDQASEEISVNFLKVMVKKYGEPLSEKEVNQMVEDAKPKGENIRIADFVKLITQSYLE